ncbi:Transmembrane nucleoporin [Polyrhizophydium stewartii]|uniref:Transmembrane nucleoporin n=1 Tax=Polyrhizophydium stewartii TaxID=2732419 RepID=A0ABR4MWT9_9FUNG
MSDRTQQQQQQTTTLQARLKRTVLRLQFVWFAGHLLTVISAALFVALGLFAPRSRSYYFALYGTLLSYGIILYKSYGLPQFNTEYLQRLVRDENTQYFVLALLWTTSAPLSVALIPYATFSVLHVLNYTRNELIPNLVGQGPRSTAMMQAISKFVQSNHAKAIYFVANAEVWVIMPATIVTIFTGHTSLFTPVVYAQFLSFRYAFSPVTKLVFGQLDQTLDRYLMSNMSLPEWLRSAVRKTRDVVVYYGDLEARARAQAAAQQGR